MKTDTLKEEFEDVKKKYEWTKEKERGHFVVPKRDMDFFIDALDYLLDEKLITLPKKVKEKKPID